MSPPENKYPKVGDVVECTDDLDIGIVISTHLDPSWSDEEKLMVEVQWIDAGRCTDAWCPLSFDTCEPLYTIVSRA